MRSPEIEVRFYETYYFANVVRNILSDRFAFLRTLNDFYGDGRHVTHSRPFPRFSAFHGFLWFVIDDMIDETDIDLIGRQEIARHSSGISAPFAPPTSELPVNLALNYYGIEHTSFESWLTERHKSFQQADDDDVQDYHSDLRLDGPLDTLIERAVQEVFFVLFPNRHVLLLFNDMMSYQIKETDLESVPLEYVSYFARSGVLQRVRLPEWVKRAVFFRDRGRLRLLPTGPIWDHQHQLQ
jgi:hypothetical protein